MSLHDGAIFGWNKMKERTFFIKELSLKICSLKEFWWWWTQKRDHFSKVSPTPIGVEFRVSTVEQGPSLKKVKYLKMYVSRAAFLLR